MESPDDVHYLKLEVSWHADLTTGFDLTFFDKDAERAERAIEQFVNDTIHDISKGGTELYYSLMMKFGRRARWASGFEKEIAAINLAAMIRSGMVIENDYNRITRWQRPLSNFAVDPVNDETKSLVKTSIKVVETLSPSDPPHLRHAFAIGRSLTNNRDAEENWHLLSASRARTRRERCGS